MNNCLNHRKAVFPNGSLNNNTGLLFKLKCINHIARAPDYSTPNTIHYHITPPYE